MSFSPDFNWNLFRNSRMRTSRNIEEFDSHVYRKKITVAKAGHFRGISNDIANSHKLFNDGVKGEVRKALSLLRKSPVKLEKIEAKPEKVILNDDELQVKKFIDAMVGKEASIYRKGGFSNEKQNSDLSSGDKIMKEARKIVKHGVKKKYFKSELGGNIEEFWKSHISKNSVVRWDIFEDNFLSYIKNFMVTDIGILSRINWLKFIQRFFLKIAKDTDDCFVWVPSPSFPVLPKLSQKTISLQDFSNTIQKQDLVLLVFACIDETPSPPIQKQNDIIYTYACGCKYKGQWQEKIREGVGSLEMCSKETYSGIFSQGLFHEFGALTGAEMVFKGFFKKGIPNGFGKMTYPDQSYFEGIFNKGLQQNGTVNFKSGSVYQGELQNSQISGRGTLTTEATQQTGMWHEGKLHGDCILKSEHLIQKGLFINGDLLSGSMKTQDFKYKGEFKSFKPHGQGEFYYTSGAIYKGNLENGLYEGFGRLEEPSFLYEGNFKENLYEGFGILKNLTGLTYAGGFLSGKPHGQGKFEKYNDVVLEYEGQVDAGVIEGLGKGLLANGSQYSGEWKNGVPFGRGKMTWGKKKYEGMFSDFLLHGDGELRIDNCYYCGSWQKGLPNGFGEAKDKSGNFYSGEFSKGVPSGKSKLNQEFLQTLLVVYKL